MKGSLFRHLFVSVLSLAAQLMLSDTSMAGDEQMKLPPARKIPGLTAEDKFPNGCADCHINMPQIKQDERLSTLMARWRKNAGAKLLKKAQAAAPAGVTLKGIHAPASGSLKNIPEACMACHSKRSRTAPPLAALLHLIHLTGGADNHFLTSFQGECTHCHKLNASTGVWRMPSGPEK
jgi:hypothetical protein